MQILKEAKVCSPEVQGCISTFCLFYFSQDLNSALCRSHCSQDWPWPSYPKPFLSCEETDSAESLS